MGWGKQIDFGMINRVALARLPDLLQIWLPDGKRMGNEYVALNPNRVDRALGSFRINLDTGRWADFAIDVRGGDPVSLAAYLEGVSQAEAARKLADILDCPVGNAGKTVLPATPEMPAKPITKQDDWRPISPVPEDVRRVIPSQWGEPAAVYDYRDEQGRLLYRVCRWDRGADKDVRPLSYGEDGRGRRSWNFRALPKPRALYGLDRLAQTPDKKVLIVEGEKAVHAAKRLFADYVAVTSSGGAQAARMSDWLPLAGRDVVIWPDHDEAGGSYARDAASCLLEAGAASVRIVEIPAEWPPGWDVADEAPQGVTLEALRAMLAHARLWTQPIDSDAANSAGENPRDLLDDLNSKHAVLTQEGGKTLVLSWEKSEFDPGCEVPVLQSFPDFKNRYSNRRVAIGTPDKTKLLKAGDWWLDHPGRREYLGLRFLPGQPHEVDGYLNLWRGFAVQPKAGCWRLMKQHVQQCLANGVEEHAEYIFNWMAWLVQNPDRPAEVALVLQGGRGAGKGTFCRALKRLFGQHGVQVTSPLQLTGRFNHHLRDTCLLFADEAIAPGDKAAESVLKALITEPQLMIEGKGLNAIQVRNRLHVVMASNESWVVPAGVDERRFAVFEVSNSVAQDGEYFAALTDEIENGGLEAILHDLLALELGDWHPRQDVPQTDALLEQKARSYRGFEAVFLDLLREGCLPMMTNMGMGRIFVATSELREYAQRVTDRRSSFNQIAHLFEQLGFERRTSGRPRGFLLPELPEARRAWDRVKSPVRWNEVTKWSRVNDPFDDDPVPSER